MAGLDQILLLLYGSPRRFVSARVAVRIWYRPELLNQAIMRSGARHEAESVTILRPAIPQSAGIRDSIARLWIRQAISWRYEFGHTAAPPERTVVVNGPNWWIYDSHAGELTTNEGAPAPHPSPIAQSLGEQDPALDDLLDPYRIIPYLWFEPQETVTYIGREAIRVKGLPRATVVPEASPALLRLGTSRYDLLVDAERGVLLRWDAYLDDQAFAGWEMRNAAFDLDMPDDIFAIAPPPETVIRRVTRPRPPQIAFW